QRDEFGGAITVSDVMNTTRDPASHHDDDGEAAVLRASLLTQAGFVDHDQPVAALSGGWRKRLAIVREISRKPDLLLIDEPTNHLDLAGIDWLEELLGGQRFAFVIVSHDRYLLDRVTNRTIELNPAYPDGSYSVDRPYSTFLERREEFLAGQ